MGSKIGPLQKPSNRLRLPIRGFLEQIPLVTVGSSSRSRSLHLIHIGLAPMQAGTSQRHLKNGKGAYYPERSKLAAAPTRRALAEGSSGGCALPRAMPLGRSNRSS